jgi:electron transport complex protein RnfG
MRRIAAGGKLALVCLVCALTLGIVNALTAPVIKANAVREDRAALNRLSGGGVVGEARVVGGSEYVRLFYPVRDKAGKAASYIIRLAGRGYGGDLPLLAGYKADGQILSVVLTDSDETPGLGKRAESPAYMRKFIGAGAAKPVPTRKNQLSEEDADAVSGSTVTFIGIGKALEAGSKFVKNLGDAK